MLVAWTGAQVKGAAVNVLYFDGGDMTGVASAVRAAYAAAAGGIPTGVSVQVPSSGDVIDEATGMLTGAWTDATVTPVDGGGAATAAAGVGLCSTWSTDGVVNGRRIRGRTFLVPLSTAVYDNDGTLTPAGIAAGTGFATGMLAVPGFCIWHRPSALNPATGTRAIVNGFRVRDRAAFLSSRRD